MKYFFSFLLSFSFAVNSICQLNFDITEYPSLNTTKPYAKTDFSIFEKLTKDGLPRKALTELQLLEEKAIQENNVAGYFKILDKEWNTLMSCRFDDVEIEKWLWDNAANSEKLAFPYCNILHIFLADWIQKAENNTFISFDDESLLWKIGTSTEKLKNGQINALIEFHRQKSFENANGLMKVPFKTVNGTELLAEDLFFPNYTTLFEWIAANYIESRNNYPFYGNNSSKEISDSLYYGSTEEFGKIIGKNEDQQYLLYYHLEKLNFENKRWENYADWVLSRIQCVFKNSYTPKINDFDRNRLRLKAFLEFEKQLSHDPSSAKFTYEICSNWIDLAADYHWKNKKDVIGFNKLALEKIDQSLSSFPKSSSAVSLKEMKDYLLAENLEFSIKSQAELKQDLLLNLRYKNLLKTTLSIYAVEKENSQNFPANELKKYQLRFISSQTLNFDPDPYRVFHDKDFIVNAFDQPGKYLFILGHSQSHIDSILHIDTLNNIEHFTYKIIQLSQLQIHLKTNYGQVEFLVTNALNGKPLKNAKINLIQGSNYDRRVNPITKTIYTDANGYAQTVAEYTYRYTVIYGNDSVNGNFYGSGTILPDHSKKNLVYFDRGIYRPGQKGFIKIIRYQNEPERKLSVNEALTIEIKDQNGQLLWEGKTITNEFGSASVSFSLPKDGFLLGYVNAYINGLDGHSFQVEEYKRPTFEVTFNEIQGKIKLGEALKIKGEAKAFSGYGIANANVEIVIQQYNYYPRWCSVSYEQRNFDTTITVETDASGHFEFIFIPKHFRYLYGSNFEYTATVTDQTGEVQEASHSLYVGENSYQLSINVPTNALSSDTNEIIINITNSESTEQKEKEYHYSILRKTVSKKFDQFLEDPEFKAFSDKDFEKHFPTYCYHSTKSKIEKLDSIANGTAKSGTKLALNKLVKNQPGTYVIEAFVIDETGEKIIENSSFCYIRTDTKKNQHSNNLWAITSKVDTLNKKIEVLVGSDYKKLSVYMSLNHEKKSTQWFTLKTRKKIIIPYTNEESILVQFLATKNGKSFHSNLTIAIPQKDKKLHIHLKTIRETLKPGSKEKWIATVSGENNELLVNMYDASLDQFAGNYWTSEFYKPYHSASYWENEAVNFIYRTNSNWRTYFSSRTNEANKYKFRTISCPSFGFDEGTGSGYGNGAASKDVSNGVTYMATNGFTSDLLSELIIVDLNDTPVNPRTNFNETAFFYPFVYADSSGEYRFEFILPDALTRWKFMAFAHNRQMQTGYFSQNFEAKKELMVDANEPRFFREGDQISFSAKVVNLTDKEQNTTVSLSFTDPITNQPCSDLFGKIEKQTVLLPANGSKEINWKISIPEGKISLVSYQLEAMNSLFTDAEQKTLPVLSNKTSISVSKNIVTTKSGEQIFTVEKIKALPTTAKITSVSLEMHTQPLWTTLMSLPYLMEYPYECAEQTFARYYGNVLAQKIIRENLEFKRIIETWKLTDPSAFLSELEKNPELKQIILSETPWVLDAQNENAQRKKLALLFDDNTLQYNIQSALNKLKQLRTSDNGWSWFGGEKANIYITQHILNGLYQLRELGVDIEIELLESGVNFLDNHYTTEFNHLTKENKTNYTGLSGAVAEWLAIRTYLKKDDITASVYFMNCLELNWTSLPLQAQAWAGIAFLQKNRDLAEKIKNSFLDKCTVKPEIGRYWNSNLSGFGWYESPVETQSAILTFFHKRGRMEKEIKEMQLWLLRQKQTQAWESTKATTFACYTLLVDKKSMQQQNMQTVSIRFADGTNPGTLTNVSQTILHYSGSDANSGKATVYVTPSSETPVLGALHFTYTDKMENITSGGNDLKIEKHYYQTINGKEVEIEKGTVVAMGTKIKVKITVRATQNMEFVHVKDTKGCGFEAKETLSGFHYGTAPWYQVSKDVSMNFFVEYLPKGNHTFEYEFFASSKGTLSVGPAEVQCMYAPGFRGNTGGSVFVVE